MAEAGSKKGMKSGAAKLTDEQVLEIRRKYAAGDKTHRGLALEFGVGKSAIGSIVIGDHWGHL